MARATHSWADKEAAYCQAWTRGQTSKDLWKYIPMKYRIGVVYCFADSDGYWIGLDHAVGGYVAYDGGSDCGVIHEYTITDLLAAIKTIRRTKE